MSKKQQPSSLSQSSSSNQQGQESGYNASFWMGGVSGTYLLSELSSASGGHIAALSQKNLGIGGPSFYTPRGFTPKAQKR